VSAPTEPLAPRSCSNCGQRVPTSDIYCPTCQHPMAPPPVETVRIERTPFTVPAERQGSNQFDREAIVILQFLPSGICIPLSLDTPLALGRGQTEDTVDLTDLNAFRHGVSRRHCLLHRRDNHLIVTDLGSTNGTYLDNQRLIPHQDYEASHGARLIMGTLHLTIFFNRI